MSLAQVSTVQMDLLPTIDEATFNPLRWRTPDEVGELLALADLPSLIAKIGSSPEWVWLIIAHRGSGRPWAQLCGHASRGLLVEVGFDDWSHIIAPEGARAWPRHDVGTFDWSYYACRDELHTIGSAFGAIADWMLDAEVANDYELRNVNDRRAAWRR